MRWSYWIRSISGEFDYPVGMTAGGSLTYTSLLDAPAPYSKPTQDETWVTAANGGGTLDSGPRSHLETNTHASYSGFQGGGMFSYSGRHRQTAGGFRLGEDLSEDALDTLIELQWQEFRDAYNLQEGIHYNLPPESMRYKNFVWRRVSDVHAMTSMGKMKVSKKSVDYDAQLANILRHRIVSEQVGHLPLTGDNYETIGDTLDITPTTNWQTAGLVAWEEPSSIFHTVSQVGSITVIEPQPYEKILDLSLFPFKHTGGDIFLRLMTNAAEILPPIPGFTGTATGNSFVTAQFDVTLYPIFQLPLWQYWGDEFPLRRIQNSVIDDLLRRLYNTPLLSIRITSRYY